MIKRVEIDNFQSHSHTVIDFTSGVNVIRGSSDSGKSSIMRAIDWVINNRLTGFGFSPWGSKNNVLTRVALTMENGDVVARERSNNGINRYVVIVAEGEFEYKALRNNVPDDVRSVLDMDDINIQPQKQAYFLLNETSGNVAKEFNRVAELEVMDKSLAMAKKNLGSADAEVKDLKAKIGETKEKISSTDIAVQADRSLIVMEELDKRVLGLTAEAGLLKLAVDEIVFAQDELDKVPATREAKLHIEKMKNKLKSLVDLSIMTKDIRHHVNVVVEISSSLSDLPEVSKERLDMMLLKMSDMAGREENLKELTSAVNDVLLHTDALENLPDIPRDDLDRMVGAATSINNMMDSIKEAREVVLEIDEINNSMPDELGDIFEDIDQVKEAVLDVENVEVEVKEIREVVEQVSLYDSEFVVAKKNSLAASLALDELKKEAGSCPICGGDLCDHEG